MSQRITALLAERIELLARLSETGERMQELEDVIASALGTENISPLILWAVKEERDNVRQHQPA